jgi:hypothetical protein
MTAPLAETGIMTTVTKNEARIIEMMIAITSPGLVVGSRFALNTKTETNSAGTGTNLRARCTFCYRLSLGRCLTTAPDPQSSM